MEKHELDEIKMLSAGDLLRLRQRLGMTQATLASLLGVNYVTISRWESGRNRPSALAWEKLLRMMKERGG